MMAMIWMTIGYYGDDIPHISHFFPHHILGQEIFPLKITQEDLSTLVLFVDIQIFTLTHPNIQILTLASKARL